MTDRRFSEDEVAAIFAQATDPQQSRQRQLPSGEGMTLAELQEIGREVGIAPELVAEAAKSIDQLGRPTSRKFLGLPIGVARTIDLDRRLSDTEWEQLVVDLRETFDARGAVKQEGSFRQWTNGNLQALVEPTPTGHRVRLRTMKGDSRALMIGGAAMLGVAAVTWITAVFGGAGGAAIMPVGQLGLMGAGMFAFGALRLPSWARLRRQQMEEVAGRLTHRPALPPAPDE
jgi:hypothetical protein